MPTSTRAPGTRARSGTGEGGRPVQVTTGPATDGRGDGHDGSAAVSVVHETARVLEAIRDELPRQSWPVVLGATGLVLTGVIDVPAAVGITALYYAARHWPFPHPDAAGPAR